jgi:N,N-dimethylformamidase
VPANIGGDQNDRVRADLAFAETPAGGAIFGVGSIAWCGSLSHNGYDNNVSRITANVLRRFVEEEPFGSK